MELFLTSGTAVTTLLPSYSWIVANLMFKKPIAEAKQISDTKKTEFSLIKCEKAIVYKN